MSKRLHEFIKENREAFDSYEPGGHVWERICKQKKASRKAGAIKWMSLTKWSAGAAAFLIIAALLYYQNPHTLKMSRPLVVPQHTSDNVPPEYAEEVFHFTKLIELKHQELKKIQKEQPELYHQFSGDIFKLDSNYQALKKELPDNPNQEVLIQAMIRNLQWQIDLLNKQLTIIHKIKQSKIATNENVFKST